MKKSKDPIEEYIVLSRGLIIVFLIWLLIMIFVLANMASGINADSEAIQQLQERLFLKPEIKIYENSNIIISNNYLMPVSVPVHEREIVYASLIDKLTWCESRDVHDTWGDLDYIYPAYGKAQFQERTFNWLKEKADMNYLEWKNEDDQIRLLDWAIENGYGYLWSCYSEI